MKLAPQELYNERADSYANMGSLIWKLCDLRERHACSLVRYVGDPRPLPTPVEQTEEFQKIKLKQLAEKARWLKACQEIRAIEEAHSVA
jgi:hypothetical protein